MTAVQITVILILFVPILLVAVNRLRMDVAALIIAAALGIAQLAGLGVLGPNGSPGEALKAISGFSQPTVITLMSLFVLTRSLDQSGLNRWFAKKIIRVGGNSESRLIALFAGITALFSLFMNNLAAGALMLSSAMETARRTGVKPSKLLIPVAYGSLLGGTATYFTTANIIVSDLLRIARPPQAPLNILDFLPTGGLITIVGIMYLAVAGKRLLPNREAGNEQLIRYITGSELEDYYQLSERLWELRVPSGSPLVGKTLAQSGIGSQLGVAISAIWHGSQMVFAPQAWETIAAEDVMLVVGREDRIQQLTEYGLTIGRGSGNHHLSPQGLTLCEVVVAPHSNVEGKTLKELEFRQLYGITAVALRRRGRSYRTNVGDIPLSLGDTLLVVGSPARLKGLHSSPDFFVLEPSAFDQPLDRTRSFMTMAIVLLAITASTLGVPTYLAMLVAALSVVLLNLLSMEEAYQAVEWQAIFLIAGMYAASLAMVETGLAALLGEQMIHLTALFGPLGLAAGGYLLTALLTQFMGGQVTALVTGPITISAAISMGVSPQAVAVATAIGCSASFFTPMAHPVNILMITPANYTFGDFLRVGWLLTILSFLALLAGMVLFWGL